MTEKAIEIYLRDENGTDITQVKSVIPTQYINEKNTCDAADLWILCAQSIKRIATDFPDKTQCIENIFLSGYRDGYVVLNSLVLPVSPVILGADTIPEIRDGDTVLSPLSYIRFMLTGCLTSDKDEYLYKIKDSLPEKALGKLCDFSFVYFEITKESAYLMKINRHIKVKTL